jgi:hypothetical protein
MTFDANTIDARESRFSFDRVRVMLISGIFVSSFFVKFEPAPTDLLSFLAIIAFSSSGLYLSRSFAIPLLFMFVYLLAGVASAIGIDRPPIPPLSESPLQYSMVTFYISFSGILIASYVAASPMKRYLQIERAWWIGAALGSVLGLLIYAGLKPLEAVVNAIGSAPGLGYAFRVVGGYKDPNVFSTWLVFPAVSMIQALILGRLRIGIISVGALAVIVLALLLAFSRGAWFDLGMGSILTVGLSILLSPSPRQRQHILILSFAGAIFVFVLLAILLSVPSLNAAFMDRFVLVKSYDAGETGRFGNQLNSLPMLLRMPMGLGPYQFQTIFREAPHNTFLNSFASGGWIGGIAYILWVLTAFYMGIKTVFSRSPVQAYAIPIVTTFIIMTLQGLQIDNEHWRHWFWKMGLIWGLFAALQNYVSKGMSSQDILKGWNVPATTPRA